MFRKSIAFLALLFISFLASSQELPLVVNYEPADYGGDNQNWMMSQSEDEYLYFANNKGLLEFNGAKWALYPTPNETILRSVKAIGDRIYTGCYMDFGYWTKNDFGALEYNSIPEKGSLEMIEDEQIWNIIDHNPYVLFQSLNRIYIYDSKTGLLKAVTPNRPIIKSFKVENTIYFQVDQEGLYLIENGTPKLFSDSEIITRNRIVDIFSWKGELVFLTSQKGFFAISNDLVTPWKSAANENIKGLTIYSSLQLSDGSLFLGSIADGALHLSEDGSTRYSLNQSSSLGDNTILSLFEDKMGNVWLGLDNGIDCVNNKVPYKNYVDQEGRLGAIYASAAVNGNLYLGSNQGLFYKPIGSSENFKFISGTDGQVWCLKEIDGDLFCGHDSGTFLVDGASVTLIAEVRGTWDIKKVEGEENLIMQGNYNGLNILSKNGSNWKLRNKLSGFDISSKHFEMIADRILVSHEYKGVYELNIDRDLQKVISYKKNESIEKGANASLVRHNDEIYYAYRKGVFKYNYKEKVFTRNEVLSNVFENDEFISGKLVSDDENRLWMFSENYVSYASIDKLSGSFRINKIPLPQSLRKGVKGYEDISKVNERDYLVGSSSGYLLLDPNVKIERAYKIDINAITVQELNHDPLPIALNKAENFTAFQNYLSFEYSVPSFNKFLISEYQYKLEGLHDHWSEWSSQPSVSFENLPYGSYTFNVKAKVSNDESSNIATYGFVIERPPFLSNIAIAIYIVALLLLLVLLNSFYRSYYRRQRNRLMEQDKKELELKELAAQTEIIQLKNENLKGDIESRNRELAVSTMNMIKKNKILHDIKLELKQIKDPTEIKSVVQLIDKTINDGEDWKFFEEAFNHADKNFFKKVKKRHPILTNNDLRLCVYLRLNLSSKEISPLLNISPRSVEIKRYRLRKKIGLERDINLNDYFLNL